MVLTLLIKIVALHVGPIMVDIQGFGLEFVSRSTFGGVEKCLDNFIQVLLAISVSARILENGKK